MAIDETHWQDRLTELADKYGVPAASLAFYSRGETVLAATGVLNTETGVETDTDSVFQIGSVSKSYTAVMIMCLVEQGVLDLDIPIISYVPEFRVADAGATANLTLRHLLAHTSGIDGDHFLDTGRGDDALERYLATCVELQQAVPFGAAFSYCNTGYAIAGRVIEKVTGETWDAALRELILQPLGTTHTVTLAEEAIRFRAAYGHVPGPTGSTVMAPHWAGARSMGPAGGIIASAADVLAFGRCMLAGGVGPNATRLLDTATVAEMHRPQVDLADVTMANHWGLGVMLQDWDGVRFYGHDGGTVGQSAFLRWVPEHDFVVTLLGNATGGLISLYRDLFAELFAEFCGVAMPRPLEPSGQPAPAGADQWLGVYERINFRMTVERRDEALYGTVKFSGPATAVLGGDTFEGRLEFAHGDLYVTRMLDASPDWMTVAFFGLPDGSRFVHMAGRAQHRLEVEAGSCIDSVTC